LLQSELHEANSKLDKIKLESEQNQLASDEEPKPATEKSDQAYIATFE